MDAIGWLPRPIMSDGSPANVLSEVL